MALIQKAVTALWVSSVGDGSDIASRPLDGEGGREAQGTQVPAMQNTVDS